MKKAKLQGAMEYLMTYGWTFLVIAIVLGAFYQLGVFDSSTSTQSSSCLSTTGFFCQSPILNSSGYLAIRFGQIGTSAITITNTACTANTTAPTSTQSVNYQITSGATTTIAFSCPLKSNSLGSAFKGYLWLTYSTSAQSGIVDRFAVVSSKVSTTGSSIQALGGGASIGGSASYSHYVPITITNSQGSSTGANFQQMLTINSGAYSAYIASQWNNVEFTTGSGASGTILQSWVESGASNVASSTVVWVNLPAGIGANSNTVVYMNFMTSNIMSASGPTGEAPLLSTSYATYDNGASVFPFYDNFLGNALSANWVITNQGVILGSSSVSNGLTTTAPNALSAINIHTTGLTFATPLYYEWYTAPFTTSAPSVTNFQFNNGAGLGQTTIYMGTSGSARLAYMTTTCTVVTTGAVKPIADNVGNHLYGLVNTGTVAAMYFDYSQLDSQATTCSTSGGIGAFLNFETSLSSPTEYYIRARSYPPNNIMPAISFGGII